MLYVVAGVAAMGWVVFEAVVRMLLVGHLIGTRRRVVATECHTEFGPRSSGREVCSGIWTDRAGHTHRAEVDGPVGSTHDVFVWLGRSSDQRVMAVGFLIVAGILVVIGALVLRARLSGTWDGEDADKPIVDDTGVSPPT